MFSIKMIAKKYIPNLSPLSFSRFSPRTMSDYNQKSAFSNEDDNLKVKGEEHRFSTISTSPVSYTGIYDGACDRGEKDGDSDDESWMDSSNAELEENSVEDKEAECSEPPISIVEKKRGMYDCPVLLLSEKDEKRIHKPWKKGITVKLLGHKIGYKVLES